MAQEQVGRNHNQNEESDIAETVTDSIKAEGIDEDVDTILDEIDNVLEENAEEFVRSYIQKGGQ